MAIINGSSSFTLFKKIKNTYPTYNDLKYHLRSLVPHCNSKLQDFDDVVVLGQVISLFKY